MSSLSRNRNNTFEDALNDAVDSFYEVNEQNHPQEVWYLAGPMTGIPGFNYPRFDAVALSLRVHGFLVISPAELDQGVEREKILSSENGDLEDLRQKTGKGHENYLSRDLRIVTDDRCTGIILLDGWKHSEGAKLESFNAFKLGKKVLSYPELDPIPEYKHPWINATYNAVYGDDFK